MTVYVVMSNDYPDCVFLSEKEADNYVKAKMDEQDPKTPRIFYRYYAFKVI
jgi:hypothetical protein